MGDGACRAIAQGSHESIGNLLRTCRESDVDLLALLDGGHTLWVATGCNSKGIANISFAGKRGFDPLRLSTDSLIFAKACMTCLGSSVKPVRSRRAFVLQ